MEKGTPHCKLADVKTLVEAGKVKATASAFSGARSLGIHDLDGMCAIIMALGTTHFCKNDDPCRSPYMAGCVSHQDRRG